MRQKFYLSAIVFERCGKIKTSKFVAQQSGTEFPKELPSLKQILDSDINSSNSSCPEFLLYGSNRWGHAVSADTFSVKRQNVCWNQFSCRLKNIFFPRTFEL